MAITAADVKNLREMTGAGMMDCKKALTETDGNVDEAIKFLREKGLATAQKKAGRIAAEGKVATIISDDAKSAVIIEVNCETDFAANTDKFQDYVNALGQQILANDYADLDAFLNATSDIDSSTTVAEYHKAKIAEIGENLTIRRFEKVTSEGLVVSYIHAAGKIGVVVESDVNSDDAVVEALKNVAMQIAAMNPQYVSRTDISSAELAELREVTLESALNDPFSLPKPVLNGLIEKAVNDKVWSDEDIAIYEEKKSNMNFLPNFLSEEAKVQLAGLAVADKAAISDNKIFNGLVEGRVSKQLKDICLLDQVYVKAEDGKQSVAKYLESVNKDLKITKFVRFEVGEGIEKKNEDFAAEVAAQMGK